MASSPSVLNWNPVLRVRAMNELEERRHRETTYTVPLHRTKDMKFFLQDFYRNVYTPTKKEFYQQERQKYPIVDTFYQQLCTNTHRLSFEDFWQRYEYRCDLERIASEINDQDADARHKVASSIQGIWNTVVPKSPKEKSTTVDRNTNGAAITAAPKDDDDDDDDTPLTMNPTHKPQQMTHQALDDTTRSLQDAWGAMTDAPNSPSPKKESADSEHELQQTSEFAKEEQWRASESSRMAALEDARQQVEEERKTKAKQRLEKAELAAKAEEEAQKLWEEEESRLQTQGSSESNSTGFGDDEEEEYYDEDLTETSMAEESATPVISKKSMKSTKVDKWKERLAQKRHQRRESATEEGTEVENIVPSQSTVAEPPLDSIVTKNASEDSTPMDAPVYDTNNSKEDAVCTAKKAPTKTKAKQRSSVRAEKWKKRLASKRADRNSMNRKNKADPGDDSSSREDPSNSEHSEYPHDSSEENSRKKGQAGGEDEMQREVLTFEDGSEKMARQEKITRRDAVPPAVAPPLPTKSKEKRVEEQIVEKTELEFKTEISTEELKPAQSGLGTEENSVTETKSPVPEAFSELGPLGRKSIVTDDEKEVISSMQNRAQEEAEEIPALTGDLQPETELPDVPLNARDKDGTVDQLQIERPRDNPTRATSEDEKKDSDDLAVFSSSNLGDKAVKKGKNGSDIGNVFSRERQSKSKGRQEMDISEWASAKSPRFSGPSDMAMEESEADKVPMGLSLTKVIPESVKDPVENILTESKSNAVALPYVDDNDGKKDKCECTACTIM